MFNDHNAYISVFHIYDWMMESQLTGCSAHTGFSRVLYLPTSEGFGHRRTVVALALFNWQLHASVLHFGPVQFVSSASETFATCLTLATVCLHLRCGSSTCLSSPLNSLLSSSVSVCYAQRVSNVSTSFVVPPSPEFNPQLPTYMTHSANTDLTLPVNIFLRPFLHLLFSFTFFLLN